MEALCVLRGVVGGIRGIIVRVGWVRCKLWR